VPANKHNKNTPINLLPRDEFDSSLLGRTLKWILTTFRIMVIAVELLVIIGFFSRFYLDMRNSDLNDEIEQKQAHIQAYSTLEEDFKLTQTKLRIFSQYTDESLYSSSALTRITSRIPENIQIISFTKSPAGTTLKAASLSEQSIAQMIANLKQEPDFKNISITQIESSSDSPFIIFTLETNTSETPEST